MLARSSIQQLPKGSKKQVLAFYKKENYSAKFMGFDTCYIATQQDEIIAAVIISDIGKIEDNTTLTPEFLHALVVSKKYRKQQIASKLLNVAKEHHNSIICFADVDLTKLYLKQQFELTPTEALPFIYQTRLCRYQTKQTNLVALTYGKD